MGTIPSITHTLAHTHTHTHTHLHTHTHTHTQLRRLIMYHKHQMILMRTFSLFAQAQLPMVEMLKTCSVKRDFARLCRPLIPIASDPRQRLAILKSNILILHSRKQVPLMQPLVLQFFQRRKMLLKCFHQRTIDFSVLAFFVLYFLFFSIHVFFHFFSFK